MAAYLLIVFTYLSSSDYWSLVACLCYLEKQTLKVWITCKWLLRTYITRVRPHPWTANIPNVCSRRFVGERHAHCLLVFQQTKTFGKMLKDVCHCNSILNSHKVFSQDILRWNWPYVHLFRCLFSNSVDKGTSDCTELT